MKRLACAVVLGVCGVAMGQTGVSVGQPGATVGALLRPAMGEAGVAVSGLQPDRWKLPGQLKQQTAADIGSIQKDLSGTLPGLVAEADGARRSVASDLAVASNVDALYDVLLRVTERAQIAASPEQAAMVGKALQSLEDARRSLNERMTAEARASDAQAQELRASLKKQTDAATAAQAQVTTLQAAAKPCPAPKPVVHRTTRKKPAAKPATTAAKPSGF